MSRLTEAFDAINSSAKEFSSKKEVYLDVSYEELKRLRKLARNKNNE